jgi:hypothetical protein
LNERLRQARDEGMEVVEREKDSMGAGDTG